MKLAKAYDPWGCLDTVSYEKQCMAAVWFETRFEMQCMHGVTRGSQSQPERPTVTRVRSWPPSESPLPSPCPATRSALRPARRSRGRPPPPSADAGRRCTRAPAATRGRAVVSSDGEPGPILLVPHSGTSIGTHGQKALSAQLSIAGERGIDHDGSDHKNCGASISVHGRDNRKSGCSRDKSCR